MESRYQQAFKEQANYVGMAAAVALSVMFLNPVPLLIGIGLEVCYLMFFSDSQIYTDILEKRAKQYTAERRAALRKKVLDVTNDDFDSKYEELESVRAQLDDDYATRPDWRDVIDRLDTLLGRYLEFGFQDARLRQYIETLSKQAEDNLPSLMKAGSKASQESTDLRNRLAQGREAADNYSDPTVRWVETEMASIRAYFASQVQSIQQLVDEETVRIVNGSGNQTNKDTLLKRIDIQNMMLAQAEKIGQGLVNLNQQMALIEETIRLINGQIKSKQPGQVLVDIESLVDQSETVSNFLQEITPFEDEDSQQLLLTR